LRLEHKDYDKYFICNVEVSKKEFNKKKKEIEEIIRNTHCDCGKCNLVLKDLKKGVDKIFGDFK
jgi:hypothetical protein